MDTQNKIKELIDETCDKYLCDTDHIIITGMSGGAVGVWSMVSKYGDYFHGGEGSTLYEDDFSLEYGDSPVVR